MPAGTETTDPLAGDETDDAIEPTGSPASTSLTPDAVRNSPEYRTLARTARANARALGDANRALGAARTEAEEARTAAEAQARDTQDAEIRSVLGDAGVERWAQISELSATDPLAAARAFRDFGDELAQSRLAALEQGRQAAAAATDQNAPRGNSAVTGSSGTPPPPPGQGRSVAASQPIGTPAQPEGWDEVIATTDRTFAGVVARNNDLMLRNRVTMKDRAEGAIAFLAGAYARRMKELGRPSR